MEIQANHWLPLTEYALRSGMSISTLRRKIKSNSIEYKMEEGRYLIRSDDLEDAPSVPAGFASSDAPRLPPPPAVRTTSPAAPSPAISPLPTAGLAQELAEIRSEMRLAQSESSLRWRALEARVAGIAKKLDMFAEQMGELKMLVKIFEEKLDHRG
jgi:hypothetical protein